MSAALTSRGEDVNPKRLFQEAWASSVEFDWWCLEKSASVRWDPRDVRVLKVIPSGLTSLVLAACDLW